MRSGVNIAATDFSYRHVANDWWRAQYDVPSPKSHARSVYGRHLKDGENGCGPRLQDFRHTFATRRLIEWYRAGLDVSQELPKLATYVGHVDVNHTYWYIEAVPELLQLSTECLGGCQRGHRPRGEQ
jgi:integrase